MAVIFNSHTNMQNSVVISTVPFRSMPTSLAFLAFLLEDWLWLALLDSHGLACLLLGSLLLDSLAPFCLQVTGPLFTACFEIEVLVS